eukprot:CAMPEP_0172361878 /NCGR_PEP_ID=MMETSP1060-20121228/5639_1 /TAXON_ID=37318 /ORGANISM="Pseudo-nitzschia pungens, Strain cf. cingulata" /LENGTH=504 /DNA_ID=CAMNT_0013084269 /DNA_START=293 /DNA_END=1804 /DNA_ORIENTATION=+
MQTPHSKVWKLTGLPTQIVQASIFHIQNNGGIISNSTNVDANANANVNGNGKALVPILEYGRLVQLCLSENFASPTSLLNRIRREQRKVRLDGVAWHESVVLARNFMDVFGPHWEATLDVFCEEIRSGYFGTPVPSVTICPNPKCRMLVQWYNGCSSVICYACEHFFRWDSHVTDWVQLREACRSPAEPQSIQWRRRVLALAETMVRSAIESHREQLLARKRPVLRYDDNYDSDNYECEREYDCDCDCNCNCNCNCNCDYEDLERTIDEGAYLSSPPSPSGFGDGFGLREADADEESGAAADIPVGCRSVVNAFECHDNYDDEEHTTLSCSRIETDSSLSVAEYVERTLLSAPIADGATAAANTADGSSSWSVLSGCETVHSMEQEGERPLSYCTAAKLGMSRAHKQARHQATGATPVSPSGPQPFVLVVPGPKQPLIGSPVPETHGTHPESKDDDDKCDEDDKWDPVLDVLSIYEGTKSGHGGRSALRFKGNSRTPRPACVYW